MLASSLEKDVNDPQVFAPARLDHKVNYVRVKRLFTNNITLSLSYNINH